MFSLFNPGTSQAHSDEASQIQPPSPDDLARLEVDRPPQRRLRVGNRLFFLQWALQPM